MLDTIIIVCSIGLVCGIVLVIASRFLAVPVDETAGKLKEALPGANCGACGFAGCEDYANKLAEDRSTRTNLCTPGGDETSRNISEILGVPFQDVDEQKAIVACRGNYETAQYQMDYQGPKSCKACTIYYTGRKACVYGCLGYGDCVSVCKFDALSIVDGLAVVDYDNCTGCGMCANMCPTKVISMRSDDCKVFVACTSHSKGAVTRKACSAGCIACKKCEKTCQFDAIHVVDNCAVVDADKCTGCKECIGVCPVKVIIEAS